MAIPKMIRREIFSHTTHSSKSISADIRTIPSSIFHKIALEIPLVPPYGSGIPTYGSQFIRQIRSPTSP
jgi:hypothetical protein